MKTGLTRIAGGSHASVWRDLAFLPASHCILYFEQREMEREFHFIQWLNSMDQSFNSFGGRVEN